MCAVLYLTPSRAASHVPPMASRAFVIVLKVREVTGNTTAMNLGEVVGERWRTTVLAKAMTMTMPC